MSRTAAAPMPSEVTLDVASADGLYAALDRIAVEGWDGPTAHTVLAYARDDVVRPQVARARLRGAVADQACGTGWEVAWEVLTGLGPVRSPWGVVATAVRRAVLGEVVAAMYATDARSAWRLRAEAAPDAASRAPAPISLSVLQERGWDPVAPGVARGRCPVLDPIAAAMVTAGWDRHDAALVLQWVASQAGSTRPGWRALAARSGLPPWRARRATVLLMGAPGWRGLVERVVREGPGVLERPDLVAAVRSTSRASHHSPAAAARLVATGCSPGYDAPQRRAS